MADPTSNIAAPTGITTTGGSMITASNSNPLFNNSSATHRGIFWLVKLVLMFSNAFTGMIGIFIVLFGFAYPEEKFPVYIGWTLIGYCGAHHQKFSFLLVYSALVVLYVFSNIVVFGVLAPKFQWLDANLVWIMCGYFSVLMVCALLLAYQIRLKEDNNNQYHNRTPYYNSGRRFASLRRMGSLRAGYGRHLSRLFGSTTDPTQSNPNLITTGNEFGPIFTQNQQTMYGGTGPLNGPAMQMTHRPPAGPTSSSSPSGPVNSQFNAQVMGPPSYQPYSPYHSPYMAASPAIPMDPPAYGGNYFGRQWQRMSSKRSALRTPSANYANGSGVQYTTCEMKNLGPGRVNFL